MTNGGRCGSSWTMGVLGSHSVVPWLPRYSLQVMEDPLCEKNEERDSFSSEDMDRQGQVRLEMLAGITVAIG
jgi:hypothetical protein